MILDTNALSAWAEGVVTIESPLRSAQRLVLPTIVLGEYWFGIRQSRYRGLHEAWLRRRLPLAEVATITSATASIYADLRLRLRQAGTPIPANDAWIAALCRQHAMPLLSNDAHFDAVDGVRRIHF